MNRVRTTLTALGLAAVMIGASAGSASAGDGDIYASSVSAGAGAATGGTAVLVDVPVSKGFRAAPQGGDQNITVAYSCTLLAAGAQRTQVSSCVITTDRGTFPMPAGTIFQGDAATESGTVVLPGSRASVCSRGFARDLLGVLVASAGACSVSLDV